MGDSDASSDAGGGGIDVMAVVRPLQKQLKKQAKQLEKLTAALDQSEKRRRADASAYEGIEKRLAEVTTGMGVMRESIEAGPWRDDLGKHRAEIDTQLRTLSATLDEQRVDDDRTKGRTRDDRRCVPRDREGTAKAALNETPPRR